MVSNSVSLSSSCDRASGLREAGYRGESGTGRLKVRRTEAFSKNGTSQSEVGGSRARTKSKFRRQQNSQIMCGTWLSRPELLRKLLGPSMLLVEMAEPLLGRRRSAVLIAKGLLDAVLHRSCASVGAAWPTVLAVR